MTICTAPSQQTGGFTQAGATSSAAYQTAAVQGALAQYDVLPFDQLTAGTTCVTVTDPAFPHQRCVTIVNLNSKAKTVTVTITPSGNGVLQPIFTTIKRTISGNGNPLKTS